MFENVIKIYCNLKSQKATNMSSAQIAKAEWIEMTNDSVMIEDNPINYRKKGFLEHFSDKEYVDSLVSLLRNKKYRPFPMSELIAIITHEGAKTSQLLHHVVWWFNHDFAKGHKSLVPLACSILSEISTKKQSQDFSPLSVAKSKRNSNSLGFVNDFEDPFLLDPDFAWPVSETCSSCQKHRNPLRNRVNVTSWSWDSKYRIYVIRRVVSTSLNSS